MAVLRVPAWLSAVLAPVAAIESGIGFSSRFTQRANRDSVQFQALAGRVRAATMSVRLFLQRNRNFYIGISADESIRRRGWF